MARATTYTIELATVICNRLADGESLRSICDDADMPGKSTVMEWLAANHEFAALYAAAREMQADSLFDDVLTIADDGRNDWMATKDDGGEAMTAWRENGEALRRSQLRIDARKWMAAKLRPKKYGEKLDLNHSGAVAQTPLDLTGWSHEKKLMLLALLEEATPAAPGDR